MRDPSTDAYSGSANMGQTAVDLPGKPRSTAPKIGVHGQDDCQGNNHARCQDEGPLGDGHLRELQIQGLVHPICSGLHEVEPPGIADHCRYGQTCGESQESGADPRLDNRKASSPEQELLTNAALPVRANPSRPQDSCSTTMAAAAKTQLAVSRLRCPVKDPSSGPCG